jgi:RNA polymerase sigma factor (sigma-70 family)
MRAGWFRAQPIADDLAEYLAALRGRDVAGGHLVFVGGECCQHFPLLALGNLREIQGASEFGCDLIEFRRLTRIALKECLGRKRKQRPFVGLEYIDSPSERGAEFIRFPLMNAENDPERAAARREIRSLLESSIEALPEVYRVAFVMRDVEDMSVEETASFLGIPSATIKTRLHRARKLLRETLDERLAPSLKDTFPFAGARCARITEAVLARLSRSVCSDPPPDTGGCDVEPESPRRF